MSRIADNGRMMTMANDDEASEKEMIEIVKERDELRAKCVRLHDSIEGYCNAIAWRDCAVLDLEKVRDQYAQIAMWLAEELDRMRMKLKQAQKQLDDARDVFNEMSEDY